MDAEIREKALGHISSKMDAVYRKFNEVIGGSLKAIVDRETEMDMLDGYMADHEMYLYIFKLIKDDTDE